MVPAEWLGVLLDLDVAGLDPLADALAERMVADARSVLAGASDPTPEEAAFALSFASAARGFGLVRFERMGDALLLVWTDPPAKTPGLRALLARVAARAVGALVGASPEGVALASEAEVSVLLVHPEAAALAKTLARTGSGLGAIVDQFTSGAPT